MIMGSVAAVQSTHLRRHLVAVIIVTFVSMRGAELLILAEANVHWTILLGLMALSIMCSVYAGMLVGIGGYLLVSSTTIAIGRWLRDLRVVREQIIQKSGP